MADSEIEPMFEWRAVFEYPGSLATSGFVTNGYGPWRDTEVEARGDRPWRPEESHGRIVRLQRRQVSPAEDVPL
jgi:hypothetical protein